MKISRRAAVLEDIEFMLSLRRATMDKHLLASGMSVSDEDHMKRILFEFRSTEVFELHGRPVGILKAVRNETNWELIQIQILPEFQGAGVGSKLINEFLAEAKCACVSVNLRVLKSNPARRLYERHGFVVDGETENSFNMVRNAA